MASEGNKDVPSEALSMEQSSILGAKRKRGRPRKYEYPAHELPQKAQPIQSIPPFHCTQDGLTIRQDVLTASHASGHQSSRSINSANLMKISDNQASYYSSAPLQINSGKDDIFGKHFVGKLTKKFPGFSLITVKLKDNQVLRGWVPDENNLRPITPTDDLAPELPMLRPSQVRKRSSAIHMQAAPVPIHLEDVTIAKPLQMRRPVEKTTAKHTIPLAPRPNMGSGVVAAVPVSVSSSSAVTKAVAKQDTGVVIPQPIVSAVPIKSVRPLLVSSKEVSNENAVVGEKSVNELMKDSQSSNGTELSANAEKPNTALVDVEVKDSPGERQLLNVEVTDAVRESSGPIQHTDTTVIDEMKIASGVDDQPNSANSEHKNSKEASDGTRQSEQLKAETCVVKGLDGSKSCASDDVHSAHDEDGMTVDTK